jgi:hypothetical protein
MNSSNLYSVNVIFNIICNDEDYDDFNINDFHDDTKAVFLKYVKETFWERDLALIIDSKLEKIDNVNIMKHGIMIDACINSSEISEEIESYIEAISEKSIIQCVLQPDKSGDEKYCVYDENTQKSFHFHYISDIYVEENTENISNI